MICIIFPNASRKFERGGENLPDLRQDGQFLVTIGFEVACALGEMPNRHVHNVSNYRVFCQMAAATLRISAGMSKWATVHPFRETFRYLHGGCSGMRRFAHEDGCNHGWPCDYRGACGGAGAASVAAVYLARLLRSPARSAKAAWLARNAPDRRPPAGLLPDDPRRRQGRADLPDPQPFPANELALSGLTILTHDAETLPTTQVRACWPEDVARGADAVVEMDTRSARACVRTCRGSSGPVRSPVRCSIDACLKIPASHPAYCIPFNDRAASPGGRSHAAADPARGWTEPAPPARADLRQRRPFACVVVAAPAGRGGEAEP